MDDLMLKRVSANLGVGSIASGKKINNTETTENGQSFSDVLERKIAEKSNISFTKHALMRAAERNLDVSDEKIERLNEGVKIASEKGLNDPLILVDKTAYIVSVKNGKVITAINASDLKGHAVTNIDGTVII